MVFIDGDCAVRPDFIAKHRQLARKGFFIAGNRILVNPTYTQDIFNRHLPIHHFSLTEFAVLRLKNRINRFIALINLPLGPLRYCRPKHWRNAMSCNAGVWKTDLLTVNCYDESFEGCGYEDSDLFIRLLHAGVKRKEGRFAVPVLHLWHPQNDRSRHDENYQRLMQRLADPSIVAAPQGLRQHDASEANSAQN